MQKHSKGGVGPSGPPPAVLDGVQTSVLERVQDTAQGRAHGETRGQTPNERGREYAQWALKWLHRFGYLTTPQLAALIYPESKSGQRLAQALTHRLEQQGLILRKRIANEPDIFALSKPGARELAGLTGWRVASGKDVIRTPSAHRAAANWAAIDLMNEGYSKVWTEREIQTHRAPIRMVDGKVPDVLACDAEGLTTWVEVENCVRGGRDLQKLANWLMFTAFPDVQHLVALDPPRDSLLLDRVRFVLAIPQARTLKGRLMRQLERLLGPKFNPDKWEGCLEFRRLFVI